MAINPPAVPFEGFVRVGGKGARCQVGSQGNPAAGLQTLFVKEANVEDSADKEDTSNFESQGFNSATTGLEGLKYDVKGDWDASLNRLATPPGIIPRDDLQMKVYTNVTDNNFWLMPYALVLSCKTAIPARSLISFDWAGESNGSFTRPDAAGD